MRLSLLQNMIDDLSWSGYSFTWIHGDDEIDTDIDIIDSMIGIFVDDGIFLPKMDLHPLQISIKGVNF